MTKQLPRPAPLGLLLATAAVGVAVFLPAPAAFRIAAAALLFAAGPGAAVVPLLLLHRDRLVAAVAVLSVSVGADVLTAQAVMATSGLTWQPCAVVLLVLTAAGAAAQLAFPRRSW